MVIEGRRQRQTKIETDIDKTYGFSSCTCDSNKSMVTKTHVCGEILKKIFFYLLQTNKTNRCAILLF